MITLEKIIQALIDAPISFSDYEVELLAEHLYEELNENQ